MNSEHFVYELPPVPIAIRQKIQSYVSEIRQVAFAQPSSESLTDLYAVSVPVACLNCSFRKTQPSCFQCGRCESRMNQRCGLRRTDKERGYI